MAAIVILGTDRRVPETRATEGSAAAADAGQTDVPRLAPGPDTRVAGQGAAVPVRPSVPGLRAYVDPVSGELREPEHDEARALDHQAAVESGAALARTSPQEPRVISGRHGGVGVVLGPEHLTSLVATVGPDGTLSFSHAAGLKDAAIAVAKGSTPRPAKEARDDR